MARSLSLDLRQRILDAILGGQSCRAAARQFCVSPSSAVRIRKRYEETQSLEPSRQGRPIGQGKLAPFRSQIIAKVKKQPDITMPDLAQWLEQTHGVRVDASNLSKLLRREGFSYKKNATGRRTHTC